MCQIRYRPVSGVPPTHDEIRKEGRPPPMAHVGHWRENPFKREDEWSRYGLSRA